MRIALIYLPHSLSFSRIKEIFLSLPEIKLTEYFFDSGVILDTEGNHISLHEVAQKNDAYILDSAITRYVQGNMHHYFEAHGVQHVFGKNHEIHIPSHDFLVTKQISVDPGKDDIEETLAALWKNIPHPIRVRKDGSISEEVSSIHELRKHALPSLVQDKPIECVYQPKGRKLVCTLVRNARGRKVYTTPLFEKISYSSGSRLSSSLLTPEIKNDIIKKLETFFSYHPTFPTLHIELVYTQKGLYLIHAAPLPDCKHESIPDALRAIGMQPTELLHACLASLSAK